MLCALNFISSRKRVVSEATIGRVAEGTESSKSECFYCNAHAIIFWSNIIGPRQTLKDSLEFCRIALKHTTIQRSYKVVEVLKNISPVLDWLSLKLATGIVDIFHCESSLSIS